MLLKKSWERDSKDRQYNYVYTGWFLFGILPIYIKRDTWKRK